MDARTRKRWVRTEIEPFLSGQAIGISANSLNDEELATAWTMIERVEKACAARKKELRAALLTRIGKNGSPDKKGHVQYSADGIRLVRQKRVSKLPDEKRFKALLSAKRVSHKSVFDPVVEHKLNPSKMQHLIDTGRIKQEEVDRLQKVTYALTVKPSETITALLDDAAVPTDTRA